MLRNIGTAVSGLAMFGAVFFAASADDIMQKTVSSPKIFWTIWGNPVKTNFVAAAQVKGGAAQRVTISPRPANPWDVGSYAGTVKPVSRGDVVVLMFWARAEKAPSGSDLVMLTGSLYEATPSDVKISPETTFLIGKQWKRYFVGGTAPKDYPAGGISAGMVLGSGEQTIDFGQIAILDLGPGYDLNNLPRE